MNGGRPQLLRAAAAVAVAVVLTAVCFYAFSTALVLALRPWLPAGQNWAEAGALARWALVAVYTLPALLAPIAGVWFAAGWFLRVPVRTVLVALLVVIALGYIAGVNAGAADWRVSLLVSALNAVGAVLGAALAVHTRERAHRPPDED